MRWNKRVIICLLLLIPISVLVAEFNINLRDTELYAEQKAALIKEAHKIKLEIDRQVTLNINTTQALAGTISLIPNISQDQFRTLVTKIAPPQPSSVEVQLTRGTVISHISSNFDRYHSLGFDLSDNPAQAQSVAQTIANQSVQIDGPFPMIGTDLQIIIIRAPVFIKGDFYGFTMYLIDFKKLIDSIVKDYPIALQKQATNQKTHPIYGNPELFSNPANISIDIPMHNQSWQLALEFKPELSSPLFKILIYVFEFLFFGFSAFIIYICIKFKELSIRDPLTGSYNRRYLQRVYKKHTFRYAISFDIDHFKKINDSFGHEVGDKAIVKFSSTLKANLRPTDILVRMGGEEFLLIIKSGTDQAALEIAERIRNAVLEIHFREGFSLSASIGVSRIQAGESLHQLLLRVDNLLYAAKRNGRNRVEHDLLGV